MDLPARIFWALYKQLSRLRAQENIRMFELLSIPNLADRNRVQEWHDKQMQTLGQVVFAKEKLDTDGWSRLKQLANQSS